MTAAHALPIMNPHAPSDVPPPTPQDEQFTPGRFGKVARDYSRDKTRVKDPVLVARSRIANAVQTGNRDLELLARQDLANAKLYRAIQEIMSMDVLPAREYREQIATLLLSL